MQLLGDVMDLVVAADASGIIREDVLDDNWFYTDVDDEALLHGPYTVAELQEWVTGDHFAITDLVRKGRTGTPVELSSVLDAAAGDASNGAVSDSTGSEDNWFYVDADDEAVLHGPHNIAELQEWFDGGM